MKFTLTVLFSLILISAKGFAQNSTEVQLDIESEIEQEVSDNNSTTELPPLDTFEAEDFSENSIEEDIANSLEADETQQPKSAQKKFIYRGKITPYEKKEKMIDHPFASKGLYKITKDLEYLYKTNESEQKHHASFRFGIFNPTNLQTEDGQFYFDELYDDAKSPMLLADWEWQLSFLGKLSLKFGSGMYYAEGNGRFNSSRAPADLKPLEDFSIFVLPNNASLVYKFQYWNKQIIVPYVDAGLDAFTMLEVQEGGDGPKLGASLGGHYSLGLALNINFLDRWAILELDRDYGINSVYLTGELRNYFHIAGAYDFSSTFVSGGFAFDF